MFKIHKNRHGKRFTSKVIAEGVSRSHGLMFDSLGVAPNCGTFSISDDRGESEIHETFEILFTTREDAEWLIAAAQAFIERLPLKG